MPVPQGVKVELDKPRRLRYTNRALVELEEASGLTVNEAARRMEAGSMKTISQVVWAGLLHEAPDLTWQDVVDMIDLERLDQVSEAVGRALNLATGGEEDPEPVSEDEDEKKGPVPEN